MGVIKRQKENIFIESGHVVDFGNEARVIKLDDHRYYSYVSGRGYKGVDFIVLDPMAGLILIELKNYIDAYNQPSESESASIFYQKCEDTLHLLEIIHAYFIKKWWVRILVYKWKLHFLLNKDDWIWLDAYDMYQAGKVVMIGDFQLMQEHI